MLGWGNGESGLALNGGVEVIDVGLAAACEAAEREIPLSDKLALGGESPVAELSDDRLR
jgi:hypothetical protein